MSAQTTLTVKQRRSLRAAFSVLFLDNLGLSIVYPIFTPLVLTPVSNLLPPEYPLSVRMVLLGFLIASFPLAQFFGGPVIGHVADVKGRKFAFILALLGEALGFAFSGFAIQMLSYPFLVFSRLLTGFFAGNLTLCLTTITDLTPDAVSRTKNFGLVASVAGIGFVIAIVIGGLLSNEVLAPFLSSAFPFWIITLLTFINLYIIRYRFTETKKECTGERHYLRKQVKEIISTFKTTNLRVLYPCFFFFMLGWVVSLQFLSSFLIEHFIGTKMQITITFVSVGIGWCLGNMWLNRLLVRFLQPKKILFYGLLLSTICLFVASEIRIYLLFFHFMLLGGVFASLAWTNCLSLISMNAPNYLQGKILGVNQSVATLSMTFAPLFGGLLGQYDIRVIYLFASTSVLLSFLILITFTKLKKIK